MEEYDVTLTEEAPETATEAPAPQILPSPVPRPAPQKHRRLFPRHYGIGMLTAVLTLLTVGIALLAASFSGSSPVIAAKLLPLGLVYLGLEIVLNILLRRSAKLFLEPRSLVLAGGIAFVLLCLSVPFMTGAPAEAAPVVTDKRAETELCLSAQACDIYEKALASAENVADVEASVSLSSVDLSVYGSIDSLLGGDRITLTVTLNGNPETPREFAESCRRLLPAIKEAALPLGTVTFINDDFFNRMSLTLDGVFELELSLDRMTEKVGYAMINYTPEEDVSDLNE